MPGSELLVLEHDPAVIFRLDSDFRITYCNAAWDRFAGDNGGRGVTRAEVQGRYLFDMIAGDARTKYHAAFESSLRTGDRWQQQYECSSAHLYRQFMMFLYPGKATPGLLVVNSLLVETPHERVAHGALEAEYQSATGLVVMCCGCRRTLRVSADDVWDWVPQYVSHPPNLVSHGLCGPCNAQYSL